MLLTNYFKTAWRNLWRTKNFSIINIAGLALGMAGCILLILNIQYEMGVDQFHKKKDHIYKAFNKGIMDGKLQAWDVTAAALAPALKKDFPEIKDVARIAITGKLFSYREQKINAVGNYADPSFLTMFSFPLIKGSTQTALQHVCSMVVTKQLAKKLFGNEDPMNKTVKIDNADNFIVTGVLKDIPKNTTLQFEYLLPWSYLQAKGNENPIWDNYYAGTFVEVQPSANISFNKYQGKIQPDYSCI